MTFYYRRNLSSRSVTPLAAPWKLNAPVKTFEKKEQAVKYWRDSSTKHYFYSLCVGQNKELSLSKKNDNPPRSLAGFVADYDDKFDVASTIQAIIRRVKTFYPAYYSETTSGGARLVWLFEKAIGLPFDEAGKKFAQTLKQKLRLDKLLPAFDEKSLDFSHYWEIGKRWVKIGQDPANTIIPFSNLEAWVTNSFKTCPPLCADIPIDTVRERLKVLNPAHDFTDFELEARISPWWIENYDQTKKCCQVVERGLLVFSTTAAEKLFLPWGDERLLGPYAQVEEEAIYARNTQDVWFEGRDYWRKLRNTYYKEDSSAIRLYLNVEQGFLSNKAKGSPSQVDKALSFIHNARRIDGVFPFLFKKEEIINYENEKFLNTSRLKLILPKTGAFSATWVCSFFKAAFKEEEQREYFTAWLAFFYQTALRENLKRGQFAIFAGPGSSGKNFVCNRIIGKLFGGFKDCARFILSKDNYNGSLFNSAVWTAHDEEPPKKGNAEISQVLKKLAANDDFMWRNMWTQGDTRPWLGRVLVSLNDDPISLQVLPQLDYNTKDKLMFFKTYDHDLVFPSLAQIAQELPILAYYLQNYEIPLELKNERWGVKPYHHPVLVEEAVSVSPDASFKELLELWRKRFFQEFVDQDEWTGNATAFYEDQLCERFQNSSRSYSSRGVGRDFRKLIKSGECSHFLSFKPFKKIYTITRPSKEELAL